VSGQSVTVYNDPVRAVNPMSLFLMDECAFPVYTVYLCALAVQCVVERRDCGAGFGTVCSPFISVVQEYD
jgi:hypothetical protein